MKREELIPAIIEGLITNGKKMFLDVNIDCTYEEIAEIIADEILSLSLSPAAEPLTAEKPMMFAEEDENELRSLMVIIDYGQPTREQMERADELTRRKWKQAEKPMTAEDVLRVHYRNDKWEPTFSNIVAAMKEYASLRTAKESLTVEPMTPQDAPQVTPQEKPMTAEGWFDNNFDCYGDSEFEVVPAMTKEVFLQYASLKPTVAEREVSDKERNQ